MLQPRLFLFVLALFMLTNSITKAQTIVDYYHLLADYDDDIKIHPIKKVDHKWQVQSTTTKEATVFVDTENNFLEIKDKAEGDIFTLQVSLLQKKNGEILVAIAKNHMDIFFHGEIHILNYRNGRWNDISEQVLPNLTYQDFVEQSVGLAAMAYNPQLNHHLEFGYQLPRIGSTASAQMQTQVLKDKCALNDVSVREYCASLHEITYSSIELNWQPEEGIFKIGAKR
ncbi:hypothetical protein [Aureispira anguillae]|uniref:Uncharacterized protein n=1 Tax=Aureispira anguillae TaxID=2864201 RepID=A0A915YID7_9BACT|nr:hypothetical protein [Aureispira anguillae]BDS13567.1 hypothetical protein AsAng_0043060 [Aureispira anguillae]